MQPYALGCATVGCFKSMSGPSNKIWALAALTLFTPPSLLALALIGRSSELLIVGFLVTIGTLLINSLLLVALLAVLVTGVKTSFARRKPIMLISLLIAGVVTDVV